MPQALGRLGKLAPRRDARQLRLARYFTHALPPPPPSLDLGAAVPSFPMYRNDVIGDCTVAAIAHMIQVWTAAVGRPFTPDERDVVDAYGRVTGYRPDVASSDRGAVEDDVLRFWRRRGLGGRKIFAWADVDPRDFEHIKQTVAIFGGAYVGIALPRTAMDQEVWDVSTAGFGSGDTAPGSWGDHAVNIEAYFDDDTVSLVTWGRRKRATRAFLAAYCDEAHAVISMDWFDVATKMTPVRLDLAQLVEDLGLVTA